MNLHLLELTAIASLQTMIRSTPLDLFFIGYNSVDTPQFALLLIIFVWLIFDARKGKRLLIAYILSAVINGLLKSLFCLPRPCHLDPSIALLYSKSPGFPSGAAQSAAIMTAALFIECKRRRIRLIGTLFTSLLCISRIYLGLHFFSDILGGLFVGCGLAFIYRWLSKSGVKIEESIISLLPLVLALISFNKYGPIIALLLGISATAFLPPVHLSSRLEKMVSVLIALLGILSLQSLIELFPKSVLILSFAEGVILSYLCGYAAFYTSAGFKRSRCN